MAVKFNDGREITATEVVLNEISMIYDYCKEKRLRCLWRSV